MQTSFEHLEITFHLENVVYYDPLEPPMFDGILSWLLLPFKKIKDGPVERGDHVEEISLPLAVETFRGVRMWKASALFPDTINIEDLRYWRKRGRVQYMDMLSKSICTTNGPHRDYNTPMPVISANKLVCWCTGNKDSLKKELKRLKYIGKKRSQGIGRVSFADVRPVDYDYSWAKDGYATRWLPDDCGNRLVRARPPYWNNTNRIACCEIGDAVKL